MNQRSDNIRRQAAAELKSRFPALYRWIEEALSQGASPAQVKATIARECETGWRQVAGRQSPAGHRTRPSLLEHAAALTVDYLAAKEARR
jgi:hypothetical protein